MSWSDTRCGPAPSRSYYSTIELGSAAQDRAVSPGHRGGRRRFVFAVVVGAVVVICVCVFGGRTTARPDPTASLATRPQGMQRPRAVSGRPARAASRGAIAAGVGAAVGVARPGAAFALPDLADVQSQWNEAVAKIPGAAELPDVATVVQVWAPACDVLHTPNGRGAAPHWAAEVRDVWIVAQACLCKPQSMDIPGCGKSRMSFETHGGHFAFKPRKRKIKP